MRREGREHGVVRTYHIFQSSPTYNTTRIINRVDPPGSAGLFARVSHKPTNHSKFTGKCGRPRCSDCHFNPVSKSKVKSKGTHKVKSADVALNYRLMTWRVVYDRSGFGFRGGGFSATRMLDELASSCYMEEDDIDNDQNDMYDGDGGHAHGMYDDGVDEIEECAIGYVHNDDDDDDDDGNMGFYDVGMMWDAVEEEHGWAIVGGMDY